MHPLNSMRRPKTGEEHMSTVVNSTLLFILILTLPGASVGSVAEQNDVPLTLAPFSQVNPAIYGDIVVWQDNRNGNWDIYGYRLPTGEEFQITADSHDQYSPAISADIVVWIDSEDESTTRTLYCYNLLTEEKTIILTSATVDSAPAIFEDTVVWAGHYKYQRGVIAYNLATGEEFLIPVSSYIYDGPAISRDIVIWSEKRPGRVLIQGFNLQERERISIPSTMISFSSDEDEMNPKIFNDVIIWTEGDVIHTANLETRKETRIAEMETCYRSFHEENLAIYKDIVVWRDCRTGRENIVGYDLSTKKGFQVTSQGSGKGTPAIYGNIVVWQDSRNGDWDIYGFDLTAPVIPLEISRRTFILSDLFEIGIIFGPLAFLLFLIGRLTADMKTFKRTVGSRLSQEKEFRRNPKPGDWIAFLFNSSCYLVLGVLFLFGMGSSFGYVAFLYASYMIIYGFFYYRWLSEIPYIFIKDSEIMIFEKPYFRPAIIPLDAIEKVNVEKWTDIPSKVKVSLLNDNRAEINLENLTEDSRKLFIHMLERVTGAS